MAEGKPSTSSGTSEAPAKKAAASTIYTRDELMSAATQFDTTPAGMAGAMQMAGLQEATADQAREAVAAYNKREV